MKHDRFGKWLIRIAVCLFVCGAALFLYPFWTRFCIQWKGSSTIQRFEDRKDDGEDQTENDPDDRRWEELYKAFQAYNEELYKSGQTGFSDPWAYEQNYFEFDTSVLEDDMIGYIEIPSIDIRMPLYLGASDEHLAGGAAQISWSSVPIGGVNTNSVIAAHRGYRGAPYFQYIERICPGDRIYITNVWEQLVYEVTETEIIDPADTKALMIREGMDLITLITCHPYTQNYQRYLVFAERVKE